MHGSLDRRTPMETMGDYDRTEDRLRHILAVVDGHLKFAETKNAALLAANAAIVLGVLQQLGSENAPNGFWYYWLLYVAGLCTASGAITLVSFLPMTDRPYLWKQPGISENDNLLFFGDIQKYSEKSFLAALAKAMTSERSSWTQLDYMLANQIIINARIAASKFGHFRAAAWLTLFALLAPVGLALAGWLWASDLKKRTRPSD